MDLARLFREIRALFRPARRAFRKLLPAPDWVRAKAAKDRMFDALHGVDTAGAIELSELCVDSRHRRFGVDYHGVDPDEFRAAMSALAIAFHEFVFVDLGSGKGRALLMAAQFPFRRIVGVEFALELHRTAERNIASFAHPRQRCRSFELHCRDVTEFRLPNEPLVLFLYNPFGDQVMQKVVANVRASWRSVRRAIYVVYLNPFHRVTWEGAGFSEIASGGHFVVLTAGSRADAKWG